MIRLLALFLSCLLAGTISFFLIVGPRPQAELVDFFPENTLALVEWKNVAKSWQEWRFLVAGKTKATEETKIVQKIFGILDPAGEGRAHLDDAQWLIALFEQYAKSSKSAFSNKKAVLALLPEADEQPFAFSSLAKQVVLALDVGIHFSPQQAVQAVQELFGPVQVQQTSIYKGEPLLTLVFENGDSLSCWFQQGVLLCARDIAPIQRCIDQSMQRKVLASSGLQLNEAYQHLKQHSRTDAEVFFYVDLEKVQYQLSTVQKKDEESRAFMPRQLAFFYLAEGGKGTMGLAAFIGKETLSTFTSHYQLAQPVKGPAFRLVSPGTGFSLWTNWFKLKKMWNAVVQYSGSDGKTLMSSIAQHLAVRTGKPFDVFFDAFGDGFGIFIKQQIVPRQSDQFMGGLIVEVRDRSAVAILMKQLFTGLQVITVKSGEAEIFLVSLAGGLLQPAYALVGKYLVLADSLELIEAVQHDLRAKQRNGAREVYSGEVGGEAGTLFVFVRTGEMIERLLLPLFTALAKESGKGNSVLSSESRLFFREFGLPLLTKLFPVATTHLRGSITDEAILFEVDYTMRRD